jgi:hypothetical protein
MSLGKKVYCKYCEQTFYSGDTEKCSLCGKVGGLVSPEVAAEIEQQRQLERSVKAKETAAIPTRAFMAFRSIRWFIGGIAVICLGAWLVFDPNLRSNPRNPTLEDLMPGIAAIIVGLGMCFLAYYFWPRTRN